ncbi:MAG: GNAT family N-acetyltransferase [Acidimicrobiales bacterium]
MSEQPLDGHPLDGHPLDNMAWHALNGAQADLAQWSEDRVAVCYPRKVFPVAAVDQLDVDGWRALGQLAGENGIISLFRSEPAPPPSGWSELFAEEITQYTSDELADPPDLGIVELGVDDVEDMVALTKLTEPGPFSYETYITGRYFGLRRDGQLLAMAGERMRVAGWGEVSAVCVHPDGQRQGLGEALTLAAASAITERGDRAMLHVRNGNDPAHRLYQRLGFEARTAINVSVLRRAEG